MWQVEGSVDGRVVVAPSPPAPPATFSVVPHTDAERLARAPESHLIRGILYANAGVLDQAAEELEQLRAQNPESEAVRQLLAQLHRWRGEPSSRR